MPSTPHRTRGPAALWGPTAMTDSSVLVTSVRAAFPGFDDRTGKEPRWRGAVASRPWPPPGSLTGAPCPVPSGSWTNCSEPGHLPALPCHTFHRDLPLAGRHAGLTPPFGGSSREPVWESQVRQHPESSLPGRQGEHGPLREPGCLESSLA